uniref:Uncharacterized protein n=1 Tax=viral metagenome TaxID=1070528 RepID=A0A6M3IXV6_9ZZZZ
MNKFDGLDKLLPYRHFLKTVGISPEKFELIIKKKFPFTNITAAALRSYYNGKRFPGWDDVHWISEASKVIDSSNPLTKMDIMYPPLRMKQLEKMKKFSEDSGESLDFDREAVGASQI